MASVDAGQAHLAGIVLLLIVPVMAAAGRSQVRGGFLAGFWSADREAKLVHIAAHRREWTWLHAAWVPALGVVTGGLVAFALLLAGAGEEALAGVGLGLFALGALAWFVGICLQAASGSVAASVRHETGATPDWLGPMWAAIGWGEVSYIALAQAAYVAWGAAMVDSGFPAEWAGWVAIGLGAASLAGIALAPRWFTVPELPFVVPVIVGVALVLV